MSKNNKDIKLNKIKEKFNKNNILVISFFIFISLAIIIGVTLGTKRLWFDVISIVSIFYIGLPILVLIFKISERGFIRKTVDLFKFKEMKNMKRQQFTAEEEKKMQAFSLKDKESKSTTYQVDLIFVSSILIAYGLLLLIITIPSLILFSIK